MIQHLILKNQKTTNFYFNLKATNGQIIGTSEMYETEASCKNGIASVKRMRRMQPLKITHK
jgi:uncharacterized protein YegP (UPF0339 family)